MNCKKVMAGFITGLLLCCCNLAVAGVPSDTPKDVKYILGFYYGNGENILIRENNSRLELLYRYSRADKCFDKANIFTLEKNHFDSYAMVEAGPINSAEVNVDFERDADGYGITCKIGGHRYSRYYLGTGDGENAKLFRFPVNEKWEEMKVQAESSSVPSLLMQGNQAELVNLTGLAGIKIDSRYAGTNNCFGQPLYSKTDLYLDSKAAAALQAVAADLAAYGFGILVWDAYRPWSVSKMAHLALPDNKKYMLENPDEKGSTHNTGLAVDVSLYELETGKPLAMISDFDEPSMRQYSSYPGGTSRQRYLRDLLRETMEKHGFSGIEMEWWHFEFKGIKEYAHLNIPLKDLK